MAVCHSEVMPQYSGRISTRKVDLSNLNKIIRERPRVFKNIVSELWSFYSGIDLLFFKDFWLKVVKMGNRLFFHPQIWSRFHRFKKWVSAALSVYLKCLTDNVQELSRALFHVLSYNPVQQLSAADLCASPHQLRGHLISSYASLGKSHIANSI